MSMTSDGWSGWGEEVYWDRDWPHGMRCAAKDCDKVFTDGEHYSQQLDGFSGDIPILVLTCVPCGLVQAELAE